MYILNSYFLIFNSINLHNQFLFIERERERETRRRTYARAEYMYK